MCPKLGIIFPKSHSSGDIGQDTGTCNACVDVMRAIDVVVVSTQHNAGWLGSGCNTHSVGSIGVLMLKYGMLRGDVVLRTGPDILGNVISLVRSCRYPSVAS